MKATPMYDATMTIGAIERAAEVMEDAARELRTQARLMKEDGDLTRAAEAARVIAAAAGQCRIDLLITRPLRAVGVK